MPRNRNHHDNHLAALGISLGVAVFGPPLLRSVFGDNSRRGYPYDHRHSHALERRNDLLPRPGEFYGTRGPVRLFDPGETGYRYAPRNSGMIHGRGGIQQPDFGRPPFGAERFTVPGQTAYEVARADAEAYRNFSGVNISRAQLDQNARNIQLDLDRRPLNDLNPYVIQGQGYTIVAPVRSRPGNADRLIGPIETHQDNAPIISGGRPAQDSPQRSGNFDRPGIGDDAPGRGQAQAPLPETSVGYPPGMGTTLKETFNPQSSGHLSPSGPSSPGTMLPRHGQFGSGQHFDPSP